MPKAMVIKCLRPRVPPDRIGLVGTGARPRNFGGCHENLLAGIKNIWSLYMQIPGLQISCEPGIVFEHCYYLQRIYFYNA